MNTRTGNENSFSSELSRNRLELTPELPLQEVLARAARYLASAGCDSPRLDAEVLLAHVLEQDRTWLYLHPLNPIGTERLNKLAELLSRRAQREPVAYLTGHKEFFGLDFEVTRSVLIPRPETELLVETVLEMARRGAPLVIADVGTGSGCIVVSLAKYLPEARFQAIDISPQALFIAGQNARRHQVADRITLIQGNLLQPAAGPFDFIVSNPPYISRSDLQPETMQPEVYRYEPHRALDGGREGLAVIERLLPQAKEKLKPGGSLLVEIGASQGQDVRQLAGRIFGGADIQVKKDLAGLDRLLVVKSQEVGVE